MAVSGSAFRQINFYPTGNVGIGLTEPQETLHVKGDISGSSYYVSTYLEVKGDISQSAATASFGMLGAGNMPFYLAASQPHKFQIWDINGDGAMVVGDSNGLVSVNLQDTYLQINDAAGSTVPFFVDRTDADVGIGTSNPSAKLHIWQADAENMFQIDSNYLFVSGTGQIGIGTAIPSYQTKLHIFDNTLKFAVGSAEGVTIGENGAVGEILGENLWGGEEFGYNDLGIRCQTGTQLYLTTGGNVGIGTTTPTELLELYKANAELLINGRADADTGRSGSLRIYGALDSTGQHGWFGRIFFDNYDDGGAPGAAYATVEAWNVASDAGASRLKFYTSNPAGTLTEQMLIDENGIITGSDFSASQDVVAGNELKSGGGLVFTTPSISTLIQNQEGAIITFTDHEIQIAPHLTSAHITSSGDARINGTLRIIDDLWFGAGDGYNMYLTGSSIEADGIAVPNLNIYNTSAGDVNIAVGGGQVGIGTATVAGSNKLEVYNGSVSASVYYGNSALFAANGEVVSTATKLFVGAGTSSFWNGIGIGTQVGSDNESIFIKNTASGVNRKYITMGDLSTNRYGKIAFYKDASTDNAGYISLDGKGNTSATFCVAGSTNVGIGVTDPDEKLEVVGDIHVSADIHVIGGINFGSVDNDTYIDYLTTDNLTFVAGGNQAMYIKSDGSVGIGGATSLAISASLHISGNNGPDGNPLVKVSSYSGSLFEIYDSMSGSLFQVNDISGIPVLDVDSGRHVTVGTQKSASYALYVNGDIGATGDIVAYASSDIRLKDNIEIISGSLKKILDLRGVEFNWKRSPLTPQYIRGRHDIGLIAQEVDEVFPEVTSKRQNGYMSIRYEKLVPALVEAIKEQQRQIEDLKDKVEKLNAYIAKRTD